MTLINKILFSKIGILKRKNGTKSVIENSCISRVSNAKYMYFGFIIDAN